MCERCADVARRQVHLARRSIFKFAPAPPPVWRSRRKPLPPTQAAAETGKRRFTRCRARPADEGQCPLRRRRQQAARLQARARSLKRGQNPFAAILSCADSRIAPEYCFDTARGDLFVCRIAGNFASDEIVASLEYAVQVLNTPLIMVLGHEACGAVDATIKSVKDGTTLPGHLPSLVDAIRPAVEAVQGPERRPADECDPPQRRAQRRKAEIGGADPEIFRRRQENPHRRRHLRTQDRAGRAC